MNTAIGKSVLASTAALLLAAPPLAASTQPGVSIAQGLSLYCVDDDWASEVYVPPYRSRHGEPAQRRQPRRHHDEGRDDGKTNGNDRRRNHHREGDSRGDIEQRYS